MSFRDIACHVWAIDGYVSDATAAAVNTRYASTGNSLFTSVQNNTQWRTLALMTLMANSRMSDTTMDYATVYGGFREGQASPEHMWLEYDGQIYETMPGSALYVYEATPNRRQQPQLEGYAFPDGGVISIKTQLTKNQRAYLEKEGFL